MMHTNHTRVAHSTRELVGAFADLRCCVRVLLALTVDSLGVSLMLNRSTDANRFASLNRNGCLCRGLAWAGHPAAGLGSLALALLAGLAERDG